MIIFFTVGVNRAGHSYDGIHSFSSAMPLSVVVALRNEEGNVNHLLESLIAQILPNSSFEIILVNDNSTDRTLEMLYSWTEKAENILVYNLPKGLRGKKSALSLGVEMASNDIIVFTDADCTHHPSWLAHIAEEFEDKSLGMLIGSVQIDSNASLFHSFQALEHASLSASTIGGCSMGIPFMASSANLAFSKSTLDFDHQLFNPEIPSGDDVFLLHSAKRKRLRIRCSLSSASAVTTRAEADLKGFLKQRARWAGKASSYTDIEAICVSMLVLIFNISLCALMVAGVFNLHLYWLLFASFVAKAAVDYSLLRAYLKRAGTVHLLKVFIPLQLVYPIYVAWVFFLTLTQRVVWKGNTY